jgi:hypothetical protein
LLTELSDEQKVQRGVLAGKYLEDETLMGFIDEMRAVLLTCIGNTQPEDHKLRTTLYYQHLGLVDLVAHLSAYRATAISINAADESQELPDADLYGAD